MTPDTSAVAVALPGSQSAEALLRAGLRRGHVEATLVDELGLTADEARTVVAEALAAESGAA